MLPSGREMWTSEDSVRGCSWIVAALLGGESDSTSLPEKEEREQADEEDEDEWCWGLGKETGEGEGESELVGDEESRWSSMGTNIKRSRFPLQLSMSWLSGLAYCLAPHFLMAQSR